MYYFGCSNCKDAWDHALMHNTNPFTDPFYYFCNNCTKDRGIFDRLDRRRMNDIQCDTRNKRI